VLSDDCNYLRAATSQMVSYSYIQRCSQIGNRLRKSGGASPALTPGDQSSAGMNEIYNHLKVELQIFSVCLYW
jgi:hypothetical protein